MKSVTNTQSIPHKAAPLQLRPVMIVDDDEDILLTARIALERHGFQVCTRTTAPNWADLHDVLPSVVFMDINLGAENGMKACQAIKANERFLALPVILISGMDGERLADAAIECHADGFLSKPYNADLLVKVAWHFVKSGSDPLD